MAPHHRQAVAGDCAPGADLAVAAEIVFPLPALEAKEDEQDLERSSPVEIDEWFKDGKETAKTMMGPGE